MVESVPMKIRPYTAADAPVPADIRMDASLAAHSFIPAKHRASCLFRGIMLPRFSFIQCHRIWAMAE